MTISPVSPVPRIFSFSIHDGDFRACCAPDGARTPARAERVGRHLVRGFGHTVGFGDVRAERCFQLRDDLRRQGGRRRADEAQLVALDYCAIVRRARHDCLVHRGDGRVPGRRRLIHSCEELEGVEARRAEDGAAAREGRQNARNQPVDVEQRHDVERAILVLVSASEFAMLPAEAKDIAMAERHDLGSRRGAGRVENEDAARLPRRRRLARSVGSRRF